MGRVPWEDLPGELRAWVESTLGARVLGAHTQPGGFSPGAACRLRLDDGRRAFCKAVSASANPESPGMHRREAEVAAALPEDVPAPRLIASYDEDEWVALLFQDVAGRPPAQPWRADELDRVLDAIGALLQSLTPSPVRSVPAVADKYAEAFTGWRSLTSAGRGGPVPGGRPLQDPWSIRHLDRLAALESAWPAAAAGDTLLHTDLRADNMLMTAGRVMFVDWPHACIGAAWFDLVAFAPSVVLDGGPEPEWLMRRVSSAAAADRDAVMAVVAALAGYFTYRATLPPPPGLPTVREFQEAQGVHARAWLRRLTGWP